MLTFTLTLLFSTCWSRAVLSLETISSFCLHISLRSDSLCLWLSRA